MSLLTIIQNVANESGLFEEPTTVISNQDAYVKKALSLLTKVGKEISSKHDWQNLTREQTFTSDGTGSYARSDVFTNGDFLRYVNNTDWDRSNEQKMQLVTQAEWQLLKSSVFSPVGLSRYYRERNNNILITPDQTGSTLVFEYISKNWITDATGVTYKEAFTVDTDIPVFPEFLMELGLNYKLRASEGLPAEVEKQDYYDELARNEGYETPKRTLGDSFMRPTNLPDSGYGQ